MKNLIQSKDFLKTYEINLNTIAKHLKRISQEYPLKDVSFYPYSTPNNLKLDELKPEDFCKIKIHFETNALHKHYLVTESGIYVSGKIEEQKCKIKFPDGKDLKWVLKPDDNASKKCLYVVSDYCLKPKNIKLDQRIITKYLDTLPESEDKQIQNGKASLIIEKAFIVGQLDSVYYSKHSKKAENATYLCFSLKKPLAEKDKVGFRMAVNVFDIQAQIEVLELLKSQPNLAALNSLISGNPSEILKDYKSLKLANPIFIDLIKKQRNPEITNAINQQVDFVKKALSSPDVAILEGPPGSGKTTVIAELINQVCSHNQSTLICAPTHVAIDNVLEKIIEKQEKEKSFFGVIPFRVAGNPKNITSNKVKRISNISGLVDYLITLNIKEFAELIELKQDEVNLLAFPSLDVDDKEKQARISLLDRSAKLLAKKVNLVGGTMTGYKSQLPLNGLIEEFDYLIVDEASKATAGLALVPSQSAKKWVYIGDPMQLSPYFEPDLAELVLRETYSRNNFDDDHSIFEELKQIYEFKNDPELVNKYSSKLFDEIQKGNYKMNTELTLIANVENESRLIACQFLPSFLEILMYGFPEVLKPNGNKEVELNKFKCEIAKDFNRFQSLDYTFRMPNTLSKIPSKYFYEGKRMISLKEEKANKELICGQIISHLDQPLSWIDCPNTKEKYSEKEIDNTIMVLKKLQKIADREHSSRKSKPTVMIICFYKDQKNKLKKAINSWFDEEYDGEFQCDEKGIGVHTVDSAQGKEADYVLLCFTKHCESSFYLVDNRLNVSLTRAKEKLIIFANHDFMRQSNSLILSNLAREVIPYKSKN